MTQQNVRGAYMNFTHDRQADWDWLGKWQPNVIRLMMQGNHTDPNSMDVNRIRRVYETVPDATILLRVWDVDDRNFEAHAAMVQDPIGEAIRQVDWWSKVFDRAASAGIPRERLMAGLNNETGPEKDGPLYAYSVQALDTATKRDVRLGVFVFSVGRPSLPGEAQYTIDTFAQLDNAILANRGAVILHEYLQPEGMYAVWRDEQGNERKDYTYLVGRHTRWSIKSPIVIGEWGVDGILYNRHPDPTYGNSGWRNFPKEWWPERYADEYVECIKQASDNVIAICPFLSDFADRKWASFDLLEAYGALLARKDLCVKDIQQPQQPSTAPQHNHLPAVGTGAGTSPAPSQPVAVRFVIVPAGARLRSKAPDGDTLEIIAPGRAVDVLGYEELGLETWARVDYDGKVGWVAAWLLGDQPPTPTPEPTPQEPQPTGDNWQRSRAFTKRWEGGFQDYDWDIGNWTGCEVGKGIKKGTNFGISACAYPHLDIRNITIEQADEIYFRDYWQRSGADKLPWPLCLLVFDTAVNFHPDTAKKWLAESDGNLLHFVALRLRGYRKSKAWPQAGNAWVDRVIEIALEAAK